LRIVRAQRPLVRWVQVQRELEGVARDGSVRAGSECKVAGILYTYRCTIACRHCCFGGSLARPDVRMTTARVVRHLRSPHELGRVVHVAGGELRYEFKPYSLTIL
jgi:hypothetical protein